MKVLFGEKSGGGLAKVEGMSQHRSISDVVAKMWGQKDDTKPFHYLPPAGQVAAHIFIGLLHNRGEIGSSVGVFTGTIVVDGHRFLIVGDLVDGSHC